MILYLRLLRDGAFETVYWGLADVTDATGLGLSKTIVTFFKDQEVPIKKVSCLCTDGASAMTGDNAGCVKFVRDIIAHLISVHCVAHRQALACKDAPVGGLKLGADAPSFDDNMADIVRAMRAGNIDENALQAEIQASAERLQARKAPVKPR